MLYWKVGADGFTEVLFQLIIVATFHVGANFSSNLLTKSQIALECVFGLKILSLVQTVTSLQMP